MFKALLAFSVAGFLVNTVMCIYEALIADYGVSIGFGLLACVFFMLLVIFGYYRMND